MKKVIAEVAISVSLALDEPFDYLVPAELAGQVSPGSVVIVPFRHKVLRGYVRRLKNSSLYEDRLKSVLKIIDVPLINNPDLLDLAEKIHRDYFCSYADALKTVLPQGIKRGLKKNPEDALNQIQDLSLTNNERDMLKLIHRDAGMILVHDLSCEKRWDLYGGFIKETLAHKKSVIFIIPDHRKINGLIERFGLSATALVLASSQKPKESLSSWLRAQGAEFSFVIGTRSAIFAPVKNLGLVIIEEEEHFALNQEQVPHYRTADIALYRARRSGCPVMFGSIAPSLETVRLAQAPAGQLIKLERETPWPQVHLVETDQASAFQGKRKIIPRPVVYRLAAALDKKEKILIFVSQKSFAGMLYCRHCKKVMTCPRCSAPLKLHKEEGTVTCPVCQAKTKQFELCPECKSSYVKFIGFGAEKISAEIRQLFPMAGCDIMIASQEYLEKPDWGRQLFDLVYIPDADTMLSHADYKATERAFAKFLKLGSIAKKDIYIQSRIKDHYVFEHLKNLDPEGFWEREWAQRRELGWPPAILMGELQVRSNYENKAREAANTCFKKLKKAARASKIAEVLESTPATPFKTRGNFRYVILVKSPEQEAVQKIVRHLVKDRPRGAIITFNPHVS